MARVSLPRAPSQVALRPVPAPFRHGPSAVARNVRGVIFGTVTSPRPGCGSPLARMDFCGLQQLIFKPSACGRFHLEPVIEFDFHRAGCYKFRRQCLGQPGERFFRRCSGGAQRASRRRHFKSPESLQCRCECEHFRCLWRLRKCGYR